MAKLDYLQQKKLNPADELREILSSLEERQLKIKQMDTTQALIFLRDLDQLDRLFAQLEAAGLDLLAEQGRFAAVQARLKKMAASFLKALGGPGALSEYRPAPPPPREQWWWYIHEILAAQQQQLLRQVALGLILILLALGGVILAFNTILAPSPEAVARVEAENSAYAAIDEGDYREALAAIEQGLVKVPGDPGLLIFKGVLNEMSGEVSEAAQSFAQAEAALNDPLTFYLGRGQLELRVNRLAEAEREVRAALKVDETSARAWFLLGQALELQDRRFEAIPAYEKAGQLALNSGDDEVVVLARLALGRIGLGPY